MAASESSPTGAKLEPETSISKIGQEEEAEAAEAAAKEDEADDETGSEGAEEPGEGEGSDATSSTLHATIWFVVSVPVLSEQITVVQPSVSTAGSDRTMAFFLACSFVRSGDLKGGRERRGREETRESFLSFPSRERAKRSER